MIAVNKRKTKEKTLMAELEDPICEKSKANRGLHLELQNLIRKRANTKHAVNLELKFVTPLLHVSSENANNVATMVSDFIKRVVSYKNLQTVHKDYLRNSKRVHHWG